MYPAGELKALALRKEALCRKIAARRRECVVAGTELTRPLEWADEAWSRWRQISPLLKTIGVPLALLLGRMFTKRMGRPGVVLRFAPLALRAVRMLMQARQRVRPQPAF